MRKYDKSLIEVWEWKELVYHNVKNLSSEEYIEKIKNDADKLFLEKGIKLTSISLKKELLRIV